MLQNSGYRGNQNYLVFAKIVYLYYMLLNWRKFEGSVAEKNPIQALVANKRTAYKKSLLAFFRNTQFKSHFKMSYQFF